MNIAAFTLTIIASSYLTVCIWIFGRKKSHYSQLRHTISELGEAGAVHERWVGRGVFLPVGLLLLLVAYLVPVAPTKALALCLAVGYVVAALFPCDIGSPLSGSSRQSIHNIGGTVEYLGGAYALLQLAKPVDPLFSVAGYVVLGAGFAISLPQLAAVRGLIQRIAEICLFGGLAWASL